MDNYVMDAAVLKSCFVTLKGCCSSSEW